VGGESRASMKAHPSEPSSLVRVSGLQKSRCSGCRKKNPLTESRDFGPIGDIQKKPAISQPGDEFEIEADRIAEAVVNGRPGHIHPMLRAPAMIHRADEGKGPKKDEEKQKEALKKTGEALLKTEAGKQIIGIAKSAAKNATAKPAGKVIAGAVAASAVAAIYAANITLPMQLPEIPLDFLYEGMKVKLTYEGPAQSPSAASISITFGERLPSASAPRAEEAGSKTDRSAGSQRSESSFVSPSGDVVDAVGRRLKTPAMMAEEWARENEEMMRNYPSRGTGMLPPQGYQMPRVWPDFRYDPSRPPGGTGLYPGPYTILPEALRAPKIDDQTKRKDEDIAVQRKETGWREVNAVPPSVQEALQSPGRTLDPGMRTFFEHRLGHDFSKVRIHDDAKAKQSAMGMNALAYTIGKNIIFGEGRYAPETRNGLQLLSHELTHVMQQEQSAEPHSILMNTDLNNEPETGAYGFTPNSSITANRSISLAHTIQFQEQKGISQAVLPQVQTIPDKSSGKIRVLIDRIGLAEITPANGEGTCIVKCGTNDKGNIEIEIVVLQSTQVALSHDIFKRYPTATIKVTKVSFPRGSPILTNPEARGSAGGSAPQPRVSTHQLSASRGRSRIPLTNEATLRPVDTSVSPPVSSASTTGIWDSIGEWVHGALDVAGLIPVYGEIADGINAAIYLAEGRYVEATISAAAMIPIIGDVGKGGKWAVKGVKELAETTAEKGATRLAESAATRGIKKTEEALVERASKEAAEAATEKGSKEAAEAATEKGSKEATGSKPPREVWTQPPVIRGITIEHYMAKLFKRLGIRRLPKSFKGIDFVSGGKRTILRDSAGRYIGETIENATVISEKTIDLSLKGAKTAEGLAKKLRGHISSLYSFEDEIREGIRVMAPKEKILNVRIPFEPTPEQLIGIKEALDYANLNKIIVNIFIF